jgi:hypothetical protein
MGGLIAYWTWGVPLDHQRGSASQRLAGSSLDRFSVVFITSTNGWLLDVGRYEWIIAPHR